TVLPRATFRNPIHPQDVLLTPIILRNGCRTPISKNEIEIAQIDEKAEALAENKHGILAIKRVHEQQKSAADREHPEAHRHDALARAFGRNPLHEEAHEKKHLRDIAECDPPIELNQEDVVEISAHGAREIN